MSSRKIPKSRTAKPTLRLRSRDSAADVVLSRALATMLAARAAAAGCSRRLRPSPARLGSWWIVRSCPYTGSSVGRATLRPAAEFERHPAFRQLDRDLDEAGVPCFPARGEDVRVLQDPSEFYQTLLVRLSACARDRWAICGRKKKRVSISADSDSIVQDKIRTAKRRIFIASLYIGKEEKELVRRPALSSQNRGKHPGTDPPSETLRPRSNPCTKPCAQTPTCN